VVIYDWYSDKENSNEQIKITVNFLSLFLKWRMFLFRF
jgi:hypothetical protein